MKRKGGETTEIPPSILCGIEGEVLSFESIEAIIAANDTDIVVTVDDRDIDTYRFEITTTDTDGKPRTQIFLAKLPRLEDPAAEALTKFYQQRRKALLARLLAPENDPKK